MATTRGVRWVAVPVAAWLVIAPWLLGFPADATASSVVTGLIAGALSQVDGDVRANFGGGWRVLVQSDEPGAGDRPNGSERNPAR